MFVRCMLLLCMGLAFSACANNAETRVAMAGMAVGVVLGTINAQQPASAQPSNHHQHVEKTQAEHHSNDEKP